MKRLTATEPAWQRHADRTGTVVIVVLACLVVTSALVVTTVQSALRGRLEARNARQLRQTELLCEAGVMRSVQRLGQSADYTGETWKPKLNQPRFDIAFSYEKPVFEQPIVEIRVLASPGNQHTRRVEVVARLTSTGNRNGPMQRSHTFTTTISAPSTETNK